jgi:hypothetical protein
LQADRGAVWFLTFAHAASGNALALALNGTMGAGVTVLASQVGSVAPVVVLRVRALRCVRLQ